MKVSELYSAGEVIAELEGSRVSSGSGDNSGCGCGEGGGAEVCQYERMSLVRHKINRNRHVNHADRRRWNMGTDLGRVTIAVAGTPEAVDADFVVPAGVTNAQDSIRTALYHLLNTYDGGELVLKQGVYVVDSSGVPTSQKEIAAININYGNNVILRGENAVITVKDNTLEAGRIFYLVHANYADLIVSGITLEGNQANNSGDIVGVNHIKTRVTTEDMTINNCRVGVKSRHSFGTIVSNDIYNCAVGVAVDPGVNCADNFIADNVIVNCATGVLADGTRTVVTNNTFVKEKYGIGEYSILSTNSSNVLVVNNDCGAKQPVFEAGAVDHVTELPQGKIY